MQRKCQPIYENELNDMYKIVLDICEQEGWTYKYFCERYGLNYKLFRVLKGKTANGSAGERSRPFYIKLIKAIDLHYSMYGIYDLGKRIL